MSQIGCLGNIVFLVSADTVKTISNMMWSGSVRYAEHKKHLGNTLTEFEGIDADDITFDIMLSRYLGVKPLAEINKILQNERSGKTLPLVLGNTKYGRYRWTIKSHKIKAQTFHGNGELTGATISLSLLEYVRS